MVDNRRSLRNLFIVFLVVCLAFLSGVVFMFVAEQTFLRGSVEQQKFSYYHYVGNGKPVSWQTCKPPSWFADGFSVQQKAVISEAVNIFGEELNTVFPEATVKEKAAVVFSFDDSLDSLVNGTAQLDTNYFGKVFSAEVKLNRNLQSTIPKDRRLFSTVLHEFGHVVGLGHTEKSIISLAKQYSPSAAKTADSVMVPFYSKPFSGLGNFDKAALKALYPDGFIKAC